MRALRQLGAISSTFSSGYRKERFFAEIRLRKLVSGFLREQADLILRKEWRLKQIENLLRDSNSEIHNRCIRRHEILSGWHRQMSRLLPWVKMIVGRASVALKNKIQQTVTRYRLALLIANGQGGGVNLIYD